MKQHGEAVKTKKHIRWWFQIFFKAILEMMIPIEKNMLSVETTIPSSLVGPCVGARWSSYQTLAPGKRRTL